MTTPTPAEVLQARQSPAERAAFYDALCGSDEGYTYSKRAEEGYGQMLWYAWGRMDAEGSTERTPDGVSEGFRLAELYRACTEDYATERAYWNDSLLGFYARHTVAPLLRRPTYDVGPLPVSDLLNGV